MLSFFQYIWFRCSQAYSGVEHVVQGKVALLEGVLGGDAGCSSAREVTHDPSTSIEAAPGDKSAPGASQGSVGTGRVPRKLTAVGSLPAYL